MGLAVLILLTSIDYTVDMHFCQGNLKSFSFFGEAKKCFEGDGMEQRCRAHDHKDHQSITKKPCCDSRSAHFKHTSNQAVSFENQVITSVQKFIAVIPSCQHLETLQLVIVKKFRDHYRPPTLIEDFQQFFQIFRL